MPDTTLVPEVSVDNQSLGAGESIGFLNIPEETNNPGWYKFREADTRDGSAYLTVNGEQVESGADSNCN